ncbi:helix-turn-helix domain-containing protein [Halosimplex sp. J119]
MQHVRVRVTANGREGEIHPVYGIVTTAPFVEWALALQWNNAGEDLGILHYVRGDADAFEEAIADVPVVRGYDIEPAGEGSFYAYISDDTTASVRELFGSLTTGTVVVVPPIRYNEDGSVTISLFGPDDELQSAIGELPDPIEVAVEEVGGLDSAAPAAEAGLTERQREAVVAALDLGYYEVPREASHEVVADALDCAPSTAAEHLRKAESKLLHGLLRSDQL